MTAVYFAVVAAVRDLACIRRGNSESLLVVAAAVAEEDTHPNTRPVAAAVGALAASRHQEFPEEACRLGRRH